MPTQALEKAEGSLAKGSQQLQEQANAYGQKAQEASKGYGLDEATLAGAAEGKGAEYQKTAQRLQGSAPLFEAFQAPEIENVQNIQDPGSLYRAESGPNYTAGQSRLDASFLRRNPEFVARQQDILAKNAALQKESQERAKSETEKARALTGEAYGKETEALRGKIGGMSEDIVKSAKQKEIEEDARRAGIDPKEFAKKNTDQIKEMIRKDLSTADPRSEQARALKFLADEYDLSDSVKIDKDTDWREFIGDPEAQKYNRLQGLLGNADMLTPSAMGAGPDAEFDQQGAYRTIMDQLVGKRRAADTSDRERLAAIEAAATGRVGEGQKAAKAQYEELLPKYQAMKNQMAGGGAPITENGVTFTPTGQVVLPEYQDTPLTWQDMLSGSEAEELNALQGDLGIMNPTAYGAGSGNPYGKTKAMQDELAKWQMSQEPQQAGIPIAQPLPTGNAGTGGTGKQQTEKDEKSKLLKTSKITGGA
jgi:hypothetical protein